jgi:tRNA G18 (ribose-2'-O)-methylase SpoU
MAELITHHIASLELPGLEPYRTMKQQFDHLNQRLFVAEGEKVVFRLLQSHFTVVSLLLPEKWLHNYEPIIKARPENEIHAYVAEKKFLEQMTGFTMYQGVLAVAKVPFTVSLDEVRIKSKPPYLFVAIEGITNAQNLGSLVRNCGAFGVHGFIVGETSASPFLRRAVRGSMGVIFQMPVIETQSLAQTLSQMRGQGIHVVAAHPHADGRMLSQARLKGDSCLVFGSEGYGLTPQILEVCDDAVAIPMHNEVDSLNVGSAAAAFLYEANRQRGRS